jgi:hypothetical protein
MKPKWPSSAFGLTLVNEDKLAMEDVPRGTI